MLKRCDFRCVLKVENVRDRRRSTGRLFQARGPATARARSPMVERRVAGTRSSAVDAERSRRRESTSDSGWINSDRCCGAAPFRQRVRWNAKFIMDALRSAPNISCISAAIKHQR